MHILFLVMAMGNFHPVCSGNFGKVAEVLALRGFENIRVYSRDSTLTITLENPVFRWEVTALAVALKDILSTALSDYSYYPDTQSAYPDTAVITRVILLLLKEDIPQVAVSFNRNARSQENPDPGTSGSRVINRPEEWAATVAALTISEDTHDAWQQVKHLVPLRRSRGRTDVVVYPQFFFENTLLKQLYEVQFNLAPAINLSLWRGMRFTGQVIIPVVNQLGYEGQFVRPGQVVLSQSFRYRLLSGRLSFGNFSANRWGADLSMRYLLPDPDFSFVLHTGYTGSSHFFDNQWKHSRPNTLTYNLGAIWFVPRFNLEMEGGFGQFIYGDIGLYGEITRWFGETAFGFWAQLGDQNTNGGFHFTIPFPDGQRKRKHGVRVRMPWYQDMLYNAGTEFYYGQTYRADPESELIRRMYRGEYLRNQLNSQSIFKRINKQDSNY